MLWRDIAKDAITTVSVDALLLLVPPVLLLLWFISLNGFFSSKGVCKLILFHLCTPIDHWLIVASLLVGASLLSLLSDRLDFFPATSQVLIVNPIDHAARSLLTSAILCELNVPVLCGLVDTEGQHFSVDLFGI